MNAIFRRTGNFRRQLSRFERTNHFVFAPRGEQIEDEFRRMAFRENDAGDTGRAGGRRSFTTFTRGEQFGKSPATSRRGVAQRKFIASIPGNFPPAFVKHCQVVTARLTSSASELMTFAKTTRVKPAGGLLNLRATPSPLPMNCCGNINSIRRPAKPPSAGINRSRTTCFAVLF